LHYELALCANMLRVIKKVYNKVISVATWHYDLSLLQRMCERYCQYVSIFNVLNIELFIVISFVIIEVNVESNRWQFHILIVSHCL
jgi:hypothetical protein